MKSINEMNDFINSIHHVLPEEISLNYVYDTDDTIECFMNFEEDSFNFSYNGRDFELPEDEEKRAAVEVLDSINFLTKSIIFIQENGLTEEHKDLIYKLAKGEENG